jgi:hypothetical protein
MVDRLGNFYGATVHGGAMTTTDPSTSSRPNTQRAS